MSNSERFYQHLEDNVEIECNAPTLKHFDLSLLYVEFFQMRDFSMRATFDTSDYSISFQYMLTFSISLTLILGPPVHPIVSLTARPCQTPSLTQNTNHKGHVNCFSGSEWRGPGPHAHFVASFGLATIPSGRSSRGP